MNAGPSTPDWPPEIAALVRHPGRVAALQGATNFRDLGGYPGAGGAPVRWGRLFRSDHLAGLTESDAARLRALGVRRAIDFRGEQERAAQAYALPGVRQLALGIEPTVVQRLDALRSAGSAMTPEVMAGLMRELYRRLIDEQSARLAEFFDHVLDEADDSPLVFHCTAGKDRTGVAAALLLLALGVPRPLVEADFLLTNEVFRHPPMPGSAAPPSALRVLWSVQPDFLATALARIDEHHGGFEHYARQRLGLTPARRAALQARYLAAG